jgi:hypothetical protein
MSIIGNIIEKLTTSKEAVSRVSANSLIDRLNESGVTEVVLTGNEATELRKQIAERLGRDLVDTPLPDSWNGVQIKVQP